MSKKYEEVEDEIAEKKNEAITSEKPVVTATQHPVRPLIEHKLNFENRPEAIEILVLDPPGPGGASHQYLIQVDPNTARPELAEGETDDREPLDLIETLISFQKGGIAEAGVNGLTQEALLAIVIDRLRSFQQGPYPCEENQIALDHCERALNTLHKRTWDRIDREVEGTEKA